MSYQNLTELKSILEKLQTGAKKKWGQNFLYNLSILDSIIEAAEINQTDFIVEVGPGLGVLTQKLLEKAQKVEAVEIDPTLYNYLKQIHQKSDKLNLINQDVLKYTPPDSKFKLVANIPYYITSPILSHFLQAKSPSQRPEIIVLLVQLEVAQKICAGQNDHNVLSLQTQVFGQPKIIKVVKPGNFFPAPKVDSAILKINVYKSPLISNFVIFHKLISTAFSQKRKTLGNSLKNGLKIDQLKLESLLNQSGIDQKIRPQNLSIQNWQKLTEVFEKNTN